MKRRELAPEERAIWERFSKGVVRLRSHEVDNVAPFETSVVTTNARSAMLAPPQKPPPSRGVTQCPATSPQRAKSLIEIGERLSGLDNTSWRELLRGKRRAERKLDLHGYVAQRAFERLHGFLLEAAQDSVRCVEIVTGLGTGGEGGILRRELPYWLERPDLRKLILGVVYTHRANKGAVRILLRAAKRRNMRP